MIVRFSVPVQIGPEASERSLIEELRKLGLELRAGAPRQPGPQVPENGRAVPVIGTAEYYAELADRNLARAIPAPVKAEISKFCLYFGVFPSSQTYVYFSHVADAELVCHVVQEDMRRLLHDVEILIGRLRQANTSLLRLDAWRTERHAIQLFTGEVTEEVASGELHANPIAAFARERITEIAAVGISLGIAAVCFCLNLLPTSPIDPLWEPVRNFVRSAYVGTTISGIVGICAIVLAYRTRRKRHAVWRWL